jgi:AcrR family transcriptional regulator
MPRTKAQNEQIREATRLAILNAATKLFAENGYVHTSMRGVAENAGISPGLTYHYFKNKEQLLIAAFDHNMATLNQAMYTVWQPQHADNRIAHLIRVIFDLIQDENRFGEYFYSLHTQPAVQPIIGTAVQYWISQLRNLFATELAQRGRPNPQIDAYLLYSLIYGTMLGYLLDPKNYPLSQVIESIIEQYD